MDLGLGIKNEAENIGEYMKIIRYIGFGILGIIVLFVATIAILPMIVDFSAYKPRIEQAVSDATGRPFTIGDDIGISVFPWLGIKFSDLSLGNPAGFTQKEFVQIKRFEVRLKVLPLLQKSLEVDKFVVDSPKIYLETTINGKNNWDNLAGKANGRVVEKKKESDSNINQTGEISLTSLKVSTFSIVNGSVRFADKKNGSIQKISGLSFDVQNIGTKKPIALDLQALFNGMPFRLYGTVGPNGNIIFEHKKLDLNLHLQALNTLDLDLNGQLVNPTDKLKFTGSVMLQPFSPKKLLAELRIPLALVPQDKSVLERLSFFADVTATPSSLNLTNGKLQLDDSTLEITTSVKQFERPNISAKLVLDSINIDRYLPPQAKKSNVEMSKNKSSVKSVEPTKQNPALQKLICNVEFDAGKITASNVKLDKMHLVLTGQNGIFHIQPLHINLYDGVVGLQATANMQKAEPYVELHLGFDGIQTLPMLQDGVDFSYLGGMLKGDIQCKMRGVNVDSILKTAEGNGNLHFTDGQIIGFDLNRLNKLSLNDLKDKVFVFDVNNKTNFGEFVVPFTLKDGICTLNNARFVSPQVQCTVAGKVNCLEKKLDMRFTPKYIGKIEDGGKKETLEVAVPFLVSGSFSDPKIRPDLKKALQDTLKDPKNIKRLINEGGKKLLKEKGGEINAVVDKISKDGKEGVKKEVQKKINKETDKIINKSVKDVEKKLNEFLPF